jgi:7,8-dihydropterin-6-yl-methyl-4-(beta-D-ribofuranosyl)aminobenzene 5'-phosphate synthase
MIRDLRITILSDNYAASLNARAEHGLGLLIEADGRRILFDTGQSGHVLCANSTAFNAPLNPLDAVVFSHGHYDHTGGLQVLLAVTTPAVVFAHPAAFEPKYLRRKDAAPRSIGIPLPCLQALDSSGARIVTTQQATEVAPGLWCTGEIPRDSGGGPGTEDFFLDAECRVHDPLLDDQALFAETADGLVVIAGCAHAGVANTLARVRALSGEQRIHALIGGLHLLSGTAADQEPAAQAIAVCDTPLLAPCHCTGPASHAFLRSRFPGKVRDAGVGTCLRFGGN